MTRTPEQLALHQILDIYARLPDGTPAAWLDLTELVLLNVLSHIDGWESTAQRTMIVGRLHDRVIRDLAAFDMAEGAVAGHA